MSAAGQEPPAAAEQPAAVPPPAAAEQPRAAPPPAGAEQPQPPGPALLRLRELDAGSDALSAARLALPERAELRQIEADASALELRSRELATRREQLSGRERALAGSSAELGTRIAHIQQQLRSGRVSFRDQEALATELASLASQRDALEDEELAELGALDEIEHEAARLEAERPMLIRRHQAARGALASAEQAIGAELDARAGERRLIAADLPRPLLAEYESLRARLGGEAVARVVRGACSGCHLLIPATEADRLRHAPEGTTARCEQCGRLLVS